MKPGNWRPAYSLTMLLLAGGAGAPSRRRDEARYKTESEYMQGSNDGYSACGC